MNLTNTISFLSKLSQNNNREWFNDNKAEFIELKAEFENYIQELITKVREIDASINPILAKDCIFRIYRDVRFSKNKAPYKTHFGAYIANGGRKSKTCGYYIHIDPEQSFLAAGAYTPEPLILKEIRYEIMDKISDFKQIIRNPGFKKYFSGLSGEKLKNPPKGFPKDFEDIDLLKFKSYEVFHTIDKNLLQSDEIESYLLDTIREALPYNQFFNKVIEFTISENQN